ncbi:DUF4158 domain-containing protein [Rhodococcus sp. T2V]|uniref:DUF4158 domain-containing protein n=1 Tax=Rhodococcus sp. T2V TaxID=3034164 RepID=UPI0023E32914|nr:DUF4158 domain-containing protein [Rhodococcus sp. T2V]MDF3310582.1 DUF4158 domain-containing protein [Rhodococcus sp. T2V]
MLALAVRLKAYQRLGYFPKLGDIPAVVVDTVRGVLDLPGGVTPKTDADRTAKRHRQFVREYLCVRYEAAKVRAVAEQAIRVAVQTKDNPADLINVALEELVRARCELPGYTTLDAMAATIRAEVNGEFFALVSGRPAWDERARLDRLLVVDPATRRSEFDRIKTPARAATLGKFKARLAHVQALDAIGPTESWLDGVPPGKVAHFAGEARVAGVDDMRKTGEAKRVTLLVALVHQQRVEARDEVVTVFCKRMAVLHNKGRERLEELREAHRSETERLIGVLGDVLAGAREATTPPEPDSGDGPPPVAGAGAEVDVAERAERLLLKTLESAGGLEQLSAAQEAVSAYHGNNYLPLLNGFYRSHRPALFTLVGALDLVPTTADRSVVDAVEFIRANRHRRGDWIEERTTHGRDGQRHTVTVDVDAFASVMWRKVLREKNRPGMLSRRHLEVCVFSHLAAELRSGDVAVVGSDSYADLGGQLDELG